MTENALTNGAEGDAAPPATEPEIPVQEGHTEPLQVAREEEQAPEPKDTGDAAGGDAQPPGDAKPKAPELPKWAQAKMAEIAAAEREARRRAKQLEEELAAARATKPHAADADADEANARANGPDPNAVQGGYRTQAEFDAAVKAEADRRASLEAAQRAENAFNASCNTAYQAGKGAYEDFDTAVANLNAVGFMDRSMLEMVLETDEPQRVLYELGSDPDKAAALIAMTPAKRAVELAKMAVAAPTGKKPAEVSNAPAPIRPVEGSARTSGDLRDDDDDATWFAKRQRQINERR